MQFPYPRSTTPSFAAARTSAYRRRNLPSRAPYAVGFVVLLLVIYYFAHSTGSSPSQSRAGTSNVVIVTVLDQEMSEKLKHDIKDNRRDYAHRHGYATFFPNATDYDLMPNTPKSWSSVPAMRHALAKFPEANWVWFLTSTALVMEPHISLRDRVLDPAKLQSLMLTDKPVVPPDSVIKTFSHLKPERVDLILAQDDKGLAAGSLLIRRGEWAKYFLDAWYDPLFRKYNFQKAERHALEHIVQWHGTILAKMALVPLRVINSHTREGLKSADSEGIYQEGDFVANFNGCAKDPGRSCDQEMAPLISRWRVMREQENRRH
ncbi:glycosyltransferase family 34 protein [Piedraia hortae CBS 480.64]|uniref:Glycosyltransferase family 34 protein n=1 Tax=Piedraia hortae CBS 480.64 TaxID=1314780 RepID=A0A6A7C0I0_9PEZI|nr:glycosyltransferase family 34 protein [Piedraia hortae CBS 480.64]